MIKKRKLNRRNFLKTSGQLAVAAPILTSMLPKALAQSYNGPKRIVIFHTGNGWPLPKWMPTVNLYNPGNFRGPITTRSDGARSASLNDIIGHQGGQLSEIIGPDLCAFRDKMMLVEGLDISVPLRSTHHYRQELGCPGYKSLDCVLEENRRFNPNRIGAVRLSAVERVNSGRVSMNRIFYAEGDRNIAYEGASRNLTGTSNVAVYDDALNYYQRIFSGVTNSPPPAQGLSQSQINHSGTSLAYEHFKSVMNSPKISSADKMKLQSHFNFLTNYERDLASKVDNSGSGNSGGSCTVPSEPRFSSDHRTMMNNHLGFIAAAIKCNTGNVFSLQISCDNSKPGDYIYSFLGVTKRLHVDLSHDHGNANSENQWAKLGKWQGDQIAKFLTALNVEEANGRTYLDNTLVIWTNNMGATWGNHEYYNKPVLMFGATDYFRTGYMYSYANARAKQGIPQGHWFTEVLKSMGLTQSDYEISGAAGFGFERNLQSVHRSDYTGRSYDLSNAAKRRGLPGMRRSV